MKTKQTVEQIQERVIFRDLQKFLKKNGIVSQIKDIRTFTLSIPRNYTLVISGFGYLYIYKGLVIESIFEEVVSLSDPEYRKKILSFVRSRIKGINKMR